MKLLSIVLFAGGIVFMILTVSLALSTEALDVTVFDFYFVVLPRYLLLVSVTLLIGGFVSAIAPHP